MQEKSDAQLLRAYAEHEADPAFTVLVQRHTNLVYSAALRQVESPDVAAEVAQNVFIGLARSAKSLSPQLAAEASLAGWLCRSARNLSLNHRRDEFRRLTRERHAMEQILSLPDDTPDWEKLRHVLDDAMAELNETDYDALVLRFFQNQNFRAVGTAIGVSDDTAQKRVARALDKLRDLLAQRGIRTTAATLGVVIAANAVQAAPVGLVVSISTAALAGTGIIATTIATQTTMNWISLKSATAIVAAAVVAVTGTHLVQQRETNRLRSENQDLLTQQKQLTAERDSALLAGGARHDEMERLRQNQNELLRLRGEVGLLRQQSKELDQLKQENQGLKTSIAEMAKASQSKIAGLDSDPFKQSAISKMNDAKLLVMALMMYAADNQKQLPMEFNQTSNYWSHADASLTSTNQFELVLQGSLTTVANPASTIAVREKEAWFANGKWFKTYGFADGHSEVHNAPDGNFEPWEQQHLIIQPGR